MQNAKKELQRIAVKNSQSLFQAVKSNDLQRCARLYENVAIMESPERELLVGRRDIQSFWQHFNLPSFSEFTEYRGKVSSIQRDSMTISAKWILGDNQYIVSNETWATQLNSPCLIIEHRVALVGSYTAALAQ